MVFLIAAAANVIAAILAIVVLKPWRRAVVARANHQSPDAVKQAASATPNAAVIA